VHPEEPGVNPLIRGDPQRRSMASTECWRVIRWYASTAGGLPFVAYEDLGTLGPLGRRIQVSR
jgi:hypothetical protein